MNQRLAYAIVRNDRSGSTGAAADHADQLQALAEKIGVELASGQVIHTHTAREFCLLLAALPDDGSNAVLVPSVANIQPGWLHALRCHADVWTADNPGYWPRRPTPAEPADFVPLEHHRQPDLTPQLCAAQPRRGGSEPTNRSR
ncbi:hypothetical protein [Nocardia sp. NPDC052566]|uniref:hypothetical protein n=1 Tax=Nocardia sp. NPDC052566 TaxID=3364330 RepID=UPI0037CCADAD